MNFSAYTTAFSPLIPWWALAAVGGAAALILALGIWRRARGVSWRALAIAVLLAILVNPALVEEKRTPQRDVAVVILDRSPSQEIGDRAAASEAALKTLTDRLAKQPDLDVRVVRAGAPQPGGGDDGTRLFAALNRALADVPHQRLAGVIMITDGEVHDVPVGDAKTAAEQLGAPLHVLLSGHPDEGDRRLVVKEAPSFGLVGKDVPLTIRVEDLPERKDAGAAEARLTWRKDGGAPHTQLVPVGSDVPL
jgi:hypothetical protein